MDIETQRLENLRQKEKLLSELKLESKRLPNRKTKPENDDDKPRGQVKRRKVGVPAAPARTSARLASAMRPSYKDDGGERYNFIERQRNGKRSRGTKDRSRKQVLNNESDDLVNDTRSLVPAANVDEIQAGWTTWKPVGQPPVRDEQAKYHFEDFPTFTPNKSPADMIREGAFGGSYFRPLKSKRLGIVVRDDWKELPSEWVRGLDVERYLINPEYNPDANKYKVACGQSIEEWEAAGWIAHEFDVRGWYQWYCRFWTGRRCDDDDRQVSRWAKCVGPRGRWRRILLKKYVQMGVRDVADYGDEDDEEGRAKEVSPVMHQTCHHWAFEVRQADLDEAWTEFG